MSAKTWPKRLGRAAKCEHSGRCSKHGHGFGRNPARRAIYHATPDIIMSDPSRPCRFRRSKFKRPGVLRNGGER